MIYALLLRHFPPDTQRTFFEAGASDGLYGSNTWFLETYLPNWSGLLVELDSCGACHLPLNRPHSQIFSGDICPTDTSIASPPAFISSCTTATPIDELKIKDCVRDYGKRKFVPCKPLRQLFSEHNIKRIDFLSLDIQNLVMSALKTIDFEKVHVSTALIECWSPECETFLRDKGLATMRITSQSDGTRGYLADVLAWNPTDWSSLCDLEEEDQHKALILAKELKAKRSQHALQKAMKKVEKKG